MKYVAGAIMFCEPYHRVIELVVPQLVIEA